MDVNAMTADVTASGSVEELLADLEMEGFGGEETIEETIETLSEGELDAVEAHEAISEAYDTQTVTIENDEQPEAAAPAAKKARAARGTKTPKTPGAPKDISAISAEFFVLVDGVTDLETNKTAVMAMIPKQKKIAEKFENLFRQVSVGKRPSVYVMSCFDVLSAKGSATSADLVAALKALDYNEGTARSQAGQVMVLFDLVGVGKRSGQVLTFNADAPMTKRLAALPAAA